MAVPTVSSLKAMGVSRFQITCDRVDCRHSSHITFEAAGVGDGEPFPQIAETRRFVCGKCGGRKVSIMPDWTKNQAVGVG